MKSPLFGLGILGIIVVNALTCSAATITFEAAASNPASLTPTVDAFRSAIGGGTVSGANGDFGGLRREINWDGVPNASADPNLLAANFFNTTSPRGAVFSTPGTGFLVSANAGQATPTLFGFANDFQTFSPQKLFTAVGSNIVDVSFFLPGTTTMATTNSFGVVFVDVEVAGATQLQFFDEGNNLIFSRDALVAGNQGLSFLGGIVDAGGPQIGRVRITAGSNTIISNGVLGNQIGDVVVMDDFIYGTPTTTTRNVPDSGSVSVLLGGALLALAALKRRCAMERSS
ncbi:MAG: VPDSG-CTERM sorting domain-containing protein [Opitutus sp.]